jgi:prepilin signal peptidase PulO-like enzyme (type II secretory pathway)
MPSLMPNLELIQVLFIITQVVFAFAFGACVGSLTNVLVYRLPLGLSVVSPPSRCPKCSTLLTWRENIPIFGWLILRGKCRFCKAPISAEYPLVEFFVAAMFAVFYTLWYITPPDFVWLGIPWGSIKPEWAMNGFAQTWPAFIALLTLLSCLVAMTLVDAKTFTIPLVLTWVPALVALFLHPLGAWLSSTTLFGGWGTGLRFTARGEVWAMATPGPSGWWWIGASIGGVIGLGISNIMIAKGWLTRSFADYDEWESSQRSAAAAPPESGTQTGSEKGRTEPSPDEGAVTREGGGWGGQHDPAAASLGSPPPDSGPLQGNIGPLHGNIGPLQGNIGPLHGNIGPLQGNIGPLQGGNGPLQGGNGPLQGGNGPLQGDNGPSHGINGPSHGKNGPSQGANGPFDGKNGPSQGANGPSHGINGPSAGVADPIEEAKNRDISEKTRVGTPLAPDSSGSGTFAQSSENSQAEMWIQYPHARREMVKELAFLAPCGLLMMVGGTIASKLAGPWVMHPATLRQIPAHDAPLWLVALGGVLLGYLVGGGVVWVFRILGSLGFGKEAIGLGDVHLMAAVGAVLGWIDPILAFFAAAFVGIAFQVVKVLSGGRIRRAMAYGPCLAIATVLVILGKPGIEKAMTAILKAPIPIDLP